MKRVFLLTVALMLFCNASAQESVYFYGVDFTQVKSFGEVRTAYEFKTAFVGINYLMIEEADKYAFGEMLGCLYAVDLQPVMKRMDTSSFEDVVTLSTEIPVFDVTAIVKNYQLSQTDGRGMVFIARMLNKANERAYYYAVLFDIATREIILVEEVDGQARGIGLRNHWAAPLYYISQKSRLRAD